MDHWINHWLSETVVVCFEVKVITTLLVPGLGMAWRSSPIWVSLGVVAGWDQTSRSCLNKFHTTENCELLLDSLSGLSTYPAYPAVRPLFVDPNILYICDIYSKGSDAEALSMPTPTGVIAPSLVLGALLTRCFTSLLPERHNCWFIDGCHNQTFKHCIRRNIAGVLSHCWEATHRVTLALLAPWILQAKMRSIWKTYCVWQGHVV